MKLSDKIVRLRKSNGMSQEELVDKLGVSRQAISRWEMGTAMPDATNILQLSRLFQVTTDYLLNDEYQSDNDLPKVKEVKTDGIHQIMIFLITLDSDGVDNSIHVCCYPAKHFLWCLEFYSFYCYGWRL